MKKVTRINDKFKKSKGDPPKCKISELWTEVINKSNSNKEDAKQIEDNIVDYFRDEKNYSEENIEHLKLFMQLAQVKLYDPDTKKAIETMVIQIAKHSQDQMKKAGASQEKRTAVRTPNEVLINILSYLKKHPIEGYSTTEIKNSFLQHTVNLDLINDFLIKVASEYQNKGNVEGEKYISALKEQLPLDTESLPQTRKHENIYGRVFDTALISYLVEHPPKEVCKAMSLASNQLADLLETVFSKGDDTQMLRSILYRFRNHIKNNGRRFWFPHPDVKSLTNIGELDGHKKIYNSLIKYLRTEKKSGIESISLPYSLVKLIVLMEQYQRQNNHPLIPWMSRTQANYQLITSETSRKNFGHKVITEGAGITLPHQPSTQKQDWMIPSERPSTFYQLQIREPSESAQTALEHGIPWAGGVSGSTNIALFTLHYFNGEKRANIDQVSYLLGVMMFLTYDGGHSLHEAMWTANQLDRQLDFGLNLSKKDSDPKKFVADYTVFQEKLKGDEAKKFQEALDAAWEKVIDYYDEHSYFNTE